MEKIDKYFWFEYHCLESHNSCDAEIWYKSHQKVLVLYIVEIGVGDSKRERLDNGQPRVYKVRFKDGLEWDVFEDELLNSTKEFSRPNPPLKPNFKNESLRKIIREYVSESISYKDAVDNLGSIQTVVNGLRGVGFLSLVRKETLRLLDRENINYIKVPSSPHSSYVFYRDGYESEAKELVDIAEKYNGYLAYYAKEEDTRRIGQILEYKPEEVEEFIYKMKNRK